MQPERQIRPSRHGTAGMHPDATRESALATNKVLKNTYMLLSATLIFSAAMAAVAMTINMPPLGMIPTLIGYFGLLFLTSKFRKSAIGIICVFALTGFMGLTLGPLISFYIENVPNGGQLVLTSLGTTGMIFLALSAYVLTTRKDFSFMGGFLMVGILGILAVIVIGFFVDMSAFSMAISAGIVLLMSGMILYQTSAIIHGGERNYIMATVSLYISLYNMFINLLMLMRGSN